MSNKGELQEGLERLRSLLKHNSELMRQAALRFEDAMAIQNQYEALKAELEWIRRERRSAMGEIEHSDE